MTVPATQPPTFANMAIPPKAKASIEIMTPDRAKEWLDRHNKSNRRLRKHRVQKLKEAILAGKWRLNGATICRAEDGRLLDGQHRLAAIVAAGLPVAVIIVTGLDDVFGTIDDTLPRNASDWLDAMMSNGANARQISAAISWCWRFEDRKMQEPGAPSVDQQFEYLKSNSGLLDSYGKLRGWKIGRLYRMVYPIVTFVHYMAALRSPEMADAFFGALATGEYGEDEALRGVVHPLREWFLTERNRTRSTKSWIMAAIVIKAWNAYRGGKGRVNSSDLRFRVNGDTPETFPEIK